MTELTIENFFKGRALNRCMYELTTLNNLMIRKILRIQGGILKSKRIRDERKKKERKRKDYKSGGHCCGAQCDTGKSRFR